jgi:HAD superfamily hydrolase (TIGR01450 family)
MRGLVLVRAIKGIIFDIDGVLEFQGSLYEGAPETVNTLRDRDYVLRFLTNSTLKSRESCTDKLKKNGFEVFVEEVITASYATAHYLKSLNPKSCWLLLDGEGINEFKEFKHDLVNPEYIVIGDYRLNFNFENLNKALRLLLQGSKLIGMIDELVDSSMGEIELNVGSWVQMLEKASGKKAVYIGKPNPFVFDLILKSTNLDR